MELLEYLAIDTIGAIRILKPGSMQVKIRQKMDRTTEPLILDSEPQGMPPSIKRHRQCLFCGNLLVSPGHNDNYHPKCSLILFNSSKTPRFCIDRPKIREIALGQLGRGESLTGFQEKFSLKHRKDRKTIAAPLSYFVAKPQPTAPELSELVNLEGAYMLFARVLGVLLIHMADVVIILARETLE